MVILRTAQNKNSIMQWIIFELLHDRIGPQSEQLLETASRQLLFE